MNRALSLSLASLGLLLAASFSWFSGCSSGSGSADAGGEGSLPDARYEDGPSFCSADVYAGGPCDPIAPDKVYCAMCEAGGCFCVNDPKSSSGVWKCNVDTSCVPTCAPDSDGCVLEGSTFADSGPIPDSFVLPEMGSDAPAGDGGLTDATPDAAASDASDAG